MSTKESTTFVLLKKNMNPSLEGCVYPPTQTIPGIDKIIVIDEAGKKSERTIKYNPKENSIFLDEHHDKDARVENIVISNGILTVESTEINKMDFLMLCNYNIGNPQRNTSINAKIKVADKAKDASQVIKERKQVIDIEYKILNMNFEDVKSYSLAFCKNENEARKLNTKSADEMRQDLLAKAVKNKELFNSGFENPVMKRKVVIMKALNALLINHNPATRTLFWRNGNPIISAPVGKEVIHYFADFSLNDDDMNNVFKALAKEVDPRAELPMEKKETPKEEVDNRSTQEITAEDAALRAKELGVIDAGDNWFWVKYKDEKYKGRKAFVAALKNDANLLAELRLDIMNA